MVNGKYNVDSPKWKLYTFIMGFTMNDIKTPLAANVGSEIQSFVRVFNVISLGMSL